MTKIMPLLAIVLMALHIVKPIGLPGLRQRRDFWKIALLMMAAILVAAAFHEW